VLALQLYLTVSVVPLMCLAGLIEERRRAQRALADRLQFEELVAGLEGFNRSVSDQDPDLPPSLIEQNTYWFERQLITTQLVGEFRFGNFSVDVRGAYANSQRESPYERSLSYVYLGDGDPNTHGVGDVDDYVNNLASGGQSATIASCSSS